MTKIKVTESFRYDETEYEKGKVVDLPESVAKSIIEKGYGKEVDDEDEEEDSETPELDISGESEEHTEENAESNDSNDTDGLDVSDAKMGGGGYLSADDVAEDDEIVIKGPGEWDDQFVQDEDDEPDLVLPIELNGVPYQWRLNKTRMRKFAKAWGNDTGSWVGKKVVVDEPSVKYESLKETGFKVAIGE